jgi:predicted DNA-binding transcriptional regulator AlpA
MTLDRLLSLRALCRLLTVSPTTVRAWVAAGQFPSPVTLPNGRYRWRASEVAAWMTTLTAQVMTAEAGGTAGGGATVDLTSLPELAHEILQVLDEAGGKWLNGSEIATRIGEGVDHTGATWKRTTRVLREMRLIVTDRVHGFRLGPAWDQPGLTPA